MKSHKSAELNLNVSLNENVIEDGDQMSSALEQSDDSGETPAEINPEGCNRRDRRCRKILDTIG